MIGTHTIHETAKQAIVRSAVPAAQAPSQSLDASFRDRLQAMVKEEGAAPVAVAKASVVALPFHIKTGKPGAKPAAAKQPGKGDEKAPVEDDASPQATPQATPAENVTVAVTIAQAAPLAVSSVPIPAPTGGTEAPVAPSKSSPQGSAAAGKPSKHTAKVSDTTPVTMGSAIRTDTVTNTAVAPTQTVEKAHTPEAVGTSNAAAPPPLHIAHGVSNAGATASTKPSEVQAAPAGVATGPALTGDLKTLVATPNVLEVGIASGSHGWLRVRAEMGQMGQVAASVVAASAVAAEGLHKELPAISAYLAGESVGVSSLVVNAMEKGAGAQDAALNSGGQGSTGQRQDERVPAKTANSPDVEPAAAFDFEFTPMNIPAAVFANGSGSWVSVRV